MDSRSSPEVPPTTSVCNASVDISQNSSSNTAGAAPCAAGLGLGQEQTLQAPLINSTLIRWRIEESKLPS